MIFFDIDDTLVNSEAAHQIVLQKIFADHSFKINPDPIFNKWIDITNGPVDDQINKLRSNHLIRIFDPIIISEEVGFSKPQKEIFDIAAERSNQLLSECIFIGDSYELDDLGGTFSKD